MALQAGPAVLCYQVRKPGSVVVFERGKAWCEEREGKRWKRLRETSHWEYITPNERRPLDLPCANRSHRGQRTRASDQYLSAVFGMPLEKLGRDPACWTCTCKHPWRATPVLCCRLGHPRNNIFPVTVLDRITRVPNVLRSYAASAALRRSFLCEE